MSSGYARQAPVRLTIVQTHPVQYNAPWFRHIAANCPEIELTVVYAARPRPDQQGAGFDRAVRVGHAAARRLRVAAGSRGPGRRRLRDGPFPRPRRAGNRRGGRGHAPDVVLVPGWHSVTCVRAMLSARRRGVPVLYRGDTHNGTVPAGWRRAAWHVKTRAFLSLYSGYLSVGRLSRAYLESHGVAPTRIYASPHAVDNDGFAASAEPYLTGAGRAEARAACGGGPDDFVVLFAGKIEARKRPLDAVRAVASLGPNAVLAVAGWGDLEDEMRAEAERLGVRIAWLGFVNQSMMGRVYAGADCLVLPSELESWGLVVNEAMATGLPAVVADRVGCAPDLIVPGETGEVCRTGDVDDLSAALRRVRDRGARASHGRRLPRAHRPPQLRRGHDRTRGGLSVAGAARRAGAARHRLLRRHGHRVGARAHDVRGAGRRAQARRLGPLHRQQLGESPDRRAGRAHRRDLVHRVLLVFVCRAGRGACCTCCRCCGTSSAPAPGWCASPSGSGRRTCSCRSTRRCCATRRCWPR